MRYWQPKYEKMHRSDIRALQLKRLKNVVKNVYDHVPFYRQGFGNVKPQDITSLEDIARLPTTKKTDLRDNYPFGLFAIPMRDVVRLHASSGTSGKSTVVGYTAGDIVTWSDLMARNFTMVGLGPGDVFQNAVNYGLFTGGLGIHFGIERIGATAVPSGTGNTRHQLEMMIDFGVTALHCTPSYALYLAETAREHDMVDQLSLTTGCFGAEPWSANTRRELEEALGIDAYDSYGLSEMFGPGVAFECQEKDGLHIWDDHFLVEVLDKNKENVAPGERGELVLTSLTKEAMPLIRYRTGDITIIRDDECPCGRTHTILDKVVGRADDMLIVRGINVFPSQIEGVLMDISEVGDQFQVVIDRKRHKLDEMHIRVELTDRAFTGELKDLENLRCNVEDKLRTVLNLRTVVELVERGTIPRTAGKARRIVDLRKEY
ncbi:MAG: phenylacetate--CoA ligase [Methanosarcinales archaeon]|nr:phenylacetate--CoA ligase [ANME-2 cluster archaeon]MDW7775096.1 phenylacetate--CoA ligase [Methanosarcinales archaeon]